MVPNLSIQKADSTGIGSLAQAFQLHLMRSISICQNSIQLVCVELSYENKVSSLSRETIIE